MAYDIKRLPSEASVDHDHEASLHDIKISGITKSFYNNGEMRQVLRPVDILIPHGKFVSIIGPSGCGKSTLFNIVAGLLPPTSGDITIGEKSILGEKGYVGYMLQKDMLLPWRTIIDNIILGLEIKGVPKREARKQALPLMEKYGLSGFEKNYPCELSGGMRQRAALLRTLLYDREIILLDEPFGALDAQTRQSMQNWLLEIWEDFHKTVLFVTHDMDEAIKIADRICIMHDGNIVQFDTPEEILKHPVNEFVSSFVGKNRIWDSPELIRASDIMIKRVITTYPGVSLVRAYEYMRYNKVDTLMVVDHSQMLQGMITAKMIRRQPRDNHLLVRDIMVNPAYCAQEDDNLVDVMQQTRQHDFYNVPVLDEQGKLRGLITRSSLVTTFSKQFDLEEGEQA